jgi:hypothetical protein
LELQQSIKQQISDQRDRHGKQAAKDLSAKYSTHAEPCALDGFAGEQHLACK